jgi:hypothetical protein
MQRLQSSSQCWCKLSACASTTPTVQLWGILNKMAYLLKSSCRYFSLWILSNKTLKWKDTSLALLLYCQWILLHFLKVFLLFTNIYWRLVLDSLNSQSAWGTRLLSKRRRQKNVRWTRLMTYWMMKTQQHRIAIFRGRWMIWTRKRRMTKTLTARSLWELSCMNQNLTLWMKLFTSATS